MYQLLSGGQHPLGITQRESLKSCQQKLAKARESALLEDTPFLSSIAKKFLERLVMVDRTMRYTVDVALQHPWITRQKQTRLPLNLVDQLSEISYEKQLRCKLNLLHFVSIQSIWQQAQRASNSPSNNGLGSTAESDQACQDTNTTTTQGQSNGGAGAQSQQAIEMKKILNDIGNSSYKKKLLHFSKRIDHWHDEQQKLNTGVFEEDRDFVELDRSPSKFDMPLSENNSLDEFILGNQEAVQPTQTLDAQKKTEAYAVDKPDEVT